MLTLLGVDGYVMRVPNPLVPIQYRAQAIDRDELLIPEVELEDFNSDLSLRLKPMFDAVWNACGYPHSLNYEGNKNWKLLKE